MGIYYQDDQIVLYHGDCREYLAWLDADVLVTDPPYGVAYQSGWTKTQKHDRIAGDDDVDVRDRVLDMWSPKPALVFGRWDVTRPAATRARLIWDKGDSPGMGDLKMPWGRSDEEIYVLGEGFRGARSGSVLRSKVQSVADKNRPLHPTPKPVSLMEVLIAKCPPGVIADPFAGSGSTLVAAKLQGRQVIGVELEEKYCEMAAQRLAQDALPFDAVS